jgi:hypothetical protein
MQVSNDIYYFLERDLLRGNSRGGQEDEAASPLIPTKEVDEGERYGWFKVFQNLVFLQCFL